MRQGTRWGLTPHAGTWTSARGQGTTKAKEENLLSRAIRRPSNSAPPCSLQDFCLLHTPACEASSFKTGSNTGRASQVALVMKNLPASVGDVRDSGLIPGSGRSPGGGHGNPLQCSCLENPMDLGLQTLSMGILQARILERLACPPPRDLPDPGIKPESLTSPA